MTFITHHNPPEIAQPCKQTLNLPTPPVAPQLPSVFRPGPYSVAAMWSSHLGAKFSQTSVQLVTVIGPVSNQPLRPARGEVRIKILFHQRYFMRASTRDAYGDRETSTVCYCHELRTFAPLKSFQPAPMRSIQRTPLSTPRAGRPGRRGRLLGDRPSSGMKGSITAHCSSVRSIVPSRCKDRHYNTAGTRFMRLF